VARRDDLLSLDAIEDLDIMVGILRQVVLEDRPVVLDTKRAGNSRTPSSEANRVFGLRGGRFRGVP